jgi:hypothetical protein
VGTSKQLQASRFINASEEDIFALLADPSRHTEFDVADALRGPEGDTPPMLEVGQVFTMKMHQPDVGEYQEFNKVTAYMAPAATELLSRIGWAPSVDPSSPMAEKLGEMNASGHTYTYELERVEGGTKVTLIYDWSGVEDPKFEALFPLVSQEHLERTLERIAEVVG